MRKTIVLFLLSCLFIACDSNHPAVQSLQLSISSCELNNQKNYVVANILNGAGEYKVVSSNASVAKAVIENNMLYIFGVDTGSATITVIDKVNNSETVEITVNENFLYSVPIGNNVFVKKDESKILNPQYIGKKYSWGIEDGSMISVSRTSESPIIKGNKIGETTIYIIEDFRIVFYYKVHVVSQYEFQLSHSGTISFNAGNFSPKEVMIRTGNGNYTVKSSNETVVTAEIKAYTGEYYDIVNNPSVVLLTPRSAGNAVITVTDQLTGENRNVDVHVSEYF